MNDKSQIIPFNADDTRRDQVAEWLSRLDRGPLTEQERTELAQWLREDPRRKTELQAMASFWYGLNAPLAELGVSAVSGGSQPASVGVFQALAAFARSHLRATAAVTASLTLACVVLGLWVFVWQPASLTTQGYYRTQIGETRAVLLPDGSEVVLNTNTRLEHSFTGSERTLRLLSGEAIFDVTHDADRPFVVYASDGVIRAVGTRFAVRLRAENVMVAVEEGKVAVHTRVGKSLANRWPGKRHRQSLLVSQGEAADLGRNQGQFKSQLSKRDLIERLSWADGQLVFYDEELGAVIEQVARYTTVQIQLDSETLGHHRITGVLPIGDVSTMLEGIEAALGIKAHWVAPDVVELTSG